MSGVALANGHIALDGHGRAFVLGTRFRVEWIAAEHLAHGWSPAEIHYEHSNALSMAQIHAALAYYYDHQAEFEQSMRVHADELERLREAAGPSRFVERMVAEGRIR